MSDVSVRYFAPYDPGTAAEIGRLMPQLDPNFSDVPMSEGYYNRYFSGADRSILIAQLGNRVVGTAVMNTVVEQAPEAMSGYMGGFVVDKDARGSGAAEALWSLMNKWCLERGLPSFMFNTERDRLAAIRFYQKMGAQIIEGTDSHYVAYVKEKAGDEPLPAEIKEAYGIDVDVPIEPVSSGLINRTYFIGSGKNRRVFQRLNPVFDEDLIEDYETVTRCLDDDGWETPLLIRTTTGARHRRDSAGLIWRQLEFIDSDDINQETLSPKKLEQAGALLASWHRTMSKLDYQPKFELPHFHDTKYHLDKLRQLYDSLPDDETKKVAAEVLQDYERLPNLFDERKQLIHGDPQLSNMLFRDGNPITLIDLDTVMHGSIWIDVGDLIRSVLEADFMAGMRPELDNVIGIIRGYSQKAFGRVRPSFIDRAIQATQILTVELAARFLNDIVEDNYFNWDRGNFTSRRDHHMARVKVQRQIYHFLDGRIWHV